MDKNRLATLLLLVLLNILAAFSQPLSIFVDEGQYLLVSKKMLDGWVPYRDIVENKPIGMYVSLIPAVLLCGKDFVKLRIFGAFVVSLTSFLIFLIGERVKDKKIGLLGALVFIVIESFPNLYGYNLLTEPIANLFIVALFYMATCAEVSYSSALVIGALTAAACSVKQTSLFVLIPLAFVFMHAKRRRDRKKLLLSFFIGGAIVAVPMLLYLSMNSALGDAIYWNVVSLIRLGGSTLGSKFESFFVFSFFLFPFAFFALLSLEDTTERMKILWLWLLSSFIFVQIGYAWLHNYLFIAPPLSILAAAGMGGTRRKKRERSRMWESVFNGIRIVLFLAVVLLIISELRMMSEIKKNERVYSFHASWEEQREISEFISSHTNGGDGIFVFRNNAEVYYLSDRKPVTRMTFFFWDYFAMMDDSEMNEFVIGPLEQHRPRYFVFNAADFDAFEETTNSMRVKEYLDSNYELVKKSGPLEVYERKV